MSSARGRLNIIKIAIMAIQTFKNKYQFTYFNICPAINLPIAIIAAKILVICTLTSTGRCNTSLLKVGNQVPIPCSINTYRKTDNTNTKTSGLYANFSISTNSWVIPLGCCSTGVFWIGEKKTIQAVIKSTAANR